MSPLISHISLKGGDARFHPGIMRPAAAAFKGRIVSAYCR
jgi:hypothetical protein